MNVRTDLASEWSEEALKSGAIEGLRVHSFERGGVKLCEVDVLTDEAANALEKPRGKYLTLFCGRLWEDDADTFSKKVRALSEALLCVLPDSFHCALLVGLGNRQITADAVGPRSLEYALITRHLKEKQPELFSGLGLCECAALTPGVLGQTGMESAQIIRGVVEQLHPDLVVLIDALAARKLDRLAATIQLSDTGLSPGSGVGNRRISLDRISLGVPVCSIGVPTVVDAATLAYDVLENRLSGPVELSDLQTELKANGLDFFVTPKETDELLKQVSRLIGYGINLALHPGLSYEEMISLAE